MIATRPTEVPAAGRLRVPKHVALAVAVFFAGLWVYGGSARHATFWGDENDYLLTGRYFRLLFVERDLANAEWGDNYWTHTQPMLTRYIVGGWLWLRGYDLDEMPRRYDFTNSLEENIRKGRVPDEALLADARAPMVVLAAGSVVLLYLLGSALGGAAAGLVGAVVALTSRLAGGQMVRAMPEAPLAFFVLLTLLLGVLGARRAPRSDAGRLPRGWAIGLGAALGLALAAKLTAVLSVSAVAVWAALSVSRKSKVESRESGVRRLTFDFRRSTRMALALAVALVVFVASDPHLYPNPLVHTAHLFQERMNDETLRQREAPRFAIHRSLDRPGLVLKGSLVDGTFCGSQGIPIEAFLALVGFGVLLTKTWRGWRVAGRLPAESLILLTVLAYFAGTSAGLYNFHPRYFVPTLLLGTLLSGLGAAALGDFGLKLARPGRRSR